MAQPALAAIADNPERGAAAASIETPPSNVQHPRADPAQMAYSHEYWDPWVFSSDPAAVAAYGYDESYQGNFSYGDPNFQ